MKKAAAFLIKFVIIFAILEAVILYADLSVIANPLAEIEANLTGLEASGSQIFHGNEVFEISSSCTGLVSEAFYLQ